MAARNRWTSTTQNLSNLNKGSKHIAKTGGQVQLRIYPNGVVGGEKDTIRKMRVGQIQASAMSSIGLAELTDQIQAFTLPMGFKSYEDIDKVKSLLKEIAIENKNVLNEPEPRVRFREFGESGIKLQLLFWIYKPEIRGRTIDKVNTDIYNSFKKNNIIIPYPTMKVIIPEKSL